MLALLAAGPAHGFSVGRLLEPGGPVGRVYRVPRPIVYRSIERLREAGLVRAQGTEQGGRGPQRTVMEATPAGRSVASAWLAQPAGHVRDVRTEFLLKLALLDLSGGDASALIDAQEAALEPIIASLQRTHRRSSGFERTLAAWRLESARASLRFVRGL